MCGEVQWDTGILQVPSLSYWADAVFCKSCESCFGASLHLQVKFLTVSCSLGGRFEPQCPDFFQSCRDVVPNNTKSRAIPAAFLSEHQLLPTLAVYSKKHCCLVKNRHPALEGEITILTDSLSSFYSIFVLSLFKLQNFLKWSYKRPCRASHLRLRFSLSASSPWKTALNPSERVSFAPFSPIHLENIPFLMSNNLLSTVCGHPQA